MRFTKIIATLGPASSSVKMIEELAKAGVNVCRLNFSHGDYKVHAQTIENIRTVNKNGRSLAIMLDTKGPEVRTGDVKTPIEIKKGESYIFSAKKIAKPKLPVIMVDYKKFGEDVLAARCILIDNGSLEFSVESIGKDGTVTAKALEDGSIGSRRHINLPGAHISLPSFTPKDWDDIRFGIKHEVDFFALSFVRTGKDMQAIKKFLVKNGSDAEIIAKIETPEAVTNLDDIIASADGVMVARGDLGAEVPFEKVPAIQESIVHKCREAYKPVIVATQMLESMILLPMPTRAEVTDVAFASELQTDATMLSGETTTGLYPVKSVKAMDRILRMNERKEPQYDQAFQKEHASSVAIDMPRRQQALAACVLATKLEADAMVVISKHGSTAKAVSHYRPLLPIFTFTGTESVRRKMQLVWGITAFVIPFSDRTELTLDKALDLLRSEKALKKGQRVVVVSDLKTDATRVMTIQIRTM